MGIDRVVSGYMGGAVPNPSYEQVCTGETGHAEAVQITFDPNIISFRDILDVFFSVHDPTTPNRQGNDFGTQYRSALFYHSDEQRAIADETIKRIDSSKTWSNPIVTEVVPFDKFYPAEDYHQNYYENNSARPYCRIVIDPKLSKLRKQYNHKLKK